jgi:UDP:flavonoid glycosyltransferase YjiC (YdhE family)
VRVLVTFVGGLGHAEPVFPLARAARRAGHDVIVVCARPMVGAVARAGLDVEPLGATPDDDAPPAPPPTVSPLLPVDPAREDRDLRDRFAGPVATERARALLARCEELRPDVIVADEVDFGAFLAAERLGVPAVSVVVLAAGGFARTELLGPALRARREELGLAPVRPSDAPPVQVVAPVMPSFRDPAWPLPPGHLLLRPAVLDPHGGETSPAGRSSWRDARARVLVTLGTVFNLESGDLFQRLLAAVEPITEADVLVTVGPHLDPSSLGPTPAHVRIERFVPLRATLPGCDVVVSHGGSGSVVGALAHGVPLVVLAMGADQPHNARRVEALEVGRSLDPVSSSPADIGAAIEAVVADPGCRQRASALAAEATAMPTADDVVTALGW